MTANRTLIVIGLGVAILAAQPKGPPTLRTVASLNQYNQPAGIIEGSPGVFYSVTSGNVFSVTSKGTMSTLAVPPAGVSGDIARGERSRWAILLGCREQF